MPHRNDLIDRAAQDFEYARGALAQSTLDPQHIDHVAAQLVIAARIEDLELLLDSALPGAGRGN